MTNHTTRIVQAIGAALVVVCLTILALMGPEPATAKGEGTCQEDEACWDCATMGNLICGAVPVKANPPLAG